MPTILGVNFGHELFWGGAETLEKEGQKICGKKLAGELRASNFPKIRQTQINNPPPNPLCRTSGSILFISHDTCSDSIVN